MCSIVFFLRKEAFSYLETKVGEKKHEGRMEINREGMKRRRNKNYVVREECKINGGKWKKDE
jgi:hypothetical protein